MRGVWKNCFDADVVNMLLMFCLHLGAQLIKLNDEKWQVEHRNTKENIQKCMHIRKKSDMTLNYLNIFLF